MKSPDSYRGREQTYVKHFFLERYLERVAYNIGSFSSDFVYVDGFSGPWRSDDETLQDTSFMIAINALRAVRENLSKSGKRMRVRGLFIEQDATAFGRLQEAIAEVKDFDVQAIHSQFETAIPEVLQRIGSAFSLVFIDPTGWTGFRLDAITPLLRHRFGEVIINLMVDHINRFVEHPSETISSQMNALFGGTGWQNVADADDRERALVSFYCERVRAAGAFPHVTSTRILKPNDDRAYFHLVYGTRHPKGLVEFRSVEKRAVLEQERVRQVAQQAKRVRESGQGELFDAAVMPVNEQAFERTRSAQRQAAADRIANCLATAEVMTYDQLLAALLELPLVWPSDVNDLLLELRASGSIDILGMGPTQRVPKSGNDICARRAVT